MKRIMDESIIQNMITDETYHSISNAVYKNGEKLSIDVEGVKGITTYKPVISAAHEESGFDGTVYQNKDNPNEIIIGYRGTEIDDPTGRGWPDIKADLKHYVFNRGELDRTNLNNQFVQGMDLYLTTKYEYPDAKISLTGHSLGAGIATYVAALYNLEAVGFSTPSSLHLLPEKERVKAMEGYYDNKIISYIHPEDMIGAGPFVEWKRQIGSTYYIGDPYLIAHDDKSAIKRALGVANAHKLKRFSFDKFGNLNNVKIIDVLKGLFIAGSPRSTGLGSQTIELRPENLIEATEDIKRLITKVTDIASSRYRALARLNNIRIYANLQDDAMRTTNKFRDWFEEKSLETVHNIEEAAKLFKEADKLK